MIRIPQVTIEAIEGVFGGNGESLSELALSAVHKLESSGRLPPRDEIGGVIAATFSNPERFPALAVRIAAELGLRAEVAAFDLQMACSAYPYAIYMAGRLSADSGRKVLVIDGDVQSRLVDRADHATGAIFSDAVTVSVVSSDAQTEATSAFAFLSSADEALKCNETGPIKMDGMKVFTFVATEVRLMLKDFIAAAVVEGDLPRFFVPHQANPYMVRQLAKSLGMEDRLLTLSAERLNPGSCSVALTLAAARERIPAGGAEVLIAGFGAGYSAAVGIVKVL